MAINKKQKKNWKKAKKGTRRRVADPLAKKKWYNIRCPAPFSVANIGMTCVNKRSGLSNLP